MNYPVTIGKRRLWSCSQCHNVLGDREHMPCIRCAASRAEAARNEIRLVVRKGDVTTRSTWMPRERVGAAVAHFEQYGWTVLKQETRERAA